MWWGAAAGAGDEAPLFTREKSGMSSSFLSCPLAMGTPPWRMSGAARQPPDDIPQCCPAAPVVSWGIGCHNEAPGRDLPHRARGLEEVDMSKKQRVVLAAVASLALASLAAAAGKTYKVPGPVLA